MKVEDAMNYRFMIIHLVRRNADLSEYVMKMNRSIELRPVWIKICSETCLAITSM